MNARLGDASGCSLIEYTGEITRQCVRPVSKTGCSGGEAGSS